MKLLIVQIGDIHIEEVVSTVYSRLRCVAQAIKHVAADVTTIVVILSGDIAFSGRKEEYAIASANFKSMLMEIAAELKGVPVHLIGVPGNHDCDFEHPTTATRKLLLDGLARSSREKADENTLGICCQIQSAFFEFLDQHQTLKPTFGVARTCYDYLIPVGSEQVLFRCFNTAFSSTLPEIAGQMIYPLSLLHEQPINPAPTYSVAIFHHPYNWLAPNIKRAFSEHIESTCDLIFTGHEHATAYYKKEAFSGLVTNYVEGAVFQERGADACGFNVALVNLETSQERIHSFEWNGDHFSEDEITNGWQPFRRSKSRREFELGDAMTERLQDPGATFSHPAKPNLLLEDIYVPPNAQELTFKEGKDLVNKGRIASKDILNFISNKHRVLVIGKERSGKSTLAKVLFRQFYGKGLIPILIDGDEIKGTDADKFDALVEGRLRQDYKNPLLDKFRQLADDRVVVIVDDFDHAKLNARGRLKLLDGIQKKFDRLVILGDDLLRFEAMTCGELGPKILSEYAQIELMEYTLNTHCSWLT